MSAGWDSKKNNSNFLLVVILLGTMVVPLRDIKSLPALNLFQMMVRHDLQEEIGKEMRIAPLQHYLSCAFALDTGHLSANSRLLFCVLENLLRVQLKKMWSTELT